MCLEIADGGRTEPLLRRCRLESLPEHVIVNYHNVSAYAGRVTFPHGATVLLHCRELGVYKLSGYPALRCQDGTWSNPVPVCIPTTMVTNFTEDAPPTILFKILSGTASVESSGKLSVLSGTILHLECLFSRKLGNPEWTWTSTFRQYLTGWAIASEEREWKYRLSIYYSKPQDSGVYTCTTPKGLTNSITVHVKDVHCDPLDVSDDPYLVARVEGNHLGHEIRFECQRGFKLNGTSRLICQASGLWSAPPPQCLPIKCPGVENDDPHLSVVEHNTSYRGLTVFRCSWGYRLTGQSHIQCQEDGRWSGPTPACQAVQCSPLLRPLNGRVIQDGARPRRVGSTAHFACNARHQLDGQATVVCTQSGQWSHPPPTCKARCPFPGDPAHGWIAPVKFWYEPGDHLQVTCSVGYVVRLEERPQCQGDGTWSERVPECRSYQEV
ncbi:locomotion-related protein Hikaru genki [Anabrus simplex]|uniref:locomotion-related protein Hikaru genki n=1 Tax=Anabrus simplex TaxID=316456 RepID=UPI0035A385FE